MWATLPERWIRKPGCRSTLHPYEPEQRILTLIAECKAAGYPLRAIAEELNRAGHRTRTGQPFLHQNIHSLLRTIQPPS